MKKLIALSALTLAVTLSGCATQGGGDSASASASGKRDLSQVMYLRGQFAWWDALPEYQLKTVGPDLYMSSVELTADGQPYEFKFADAGWSGGTNCGYLSQAEDQNVEFGKKSKANCNSVFENFKFLPPANGIYNFYFDNSGDVPQVYIEAAK